MPLLTMASAADLTRSSVTLQPKRFQLFQPMGGVRARPFSRACAGGTQNTDPKKSESARQCVFFMRASSENFRLVLVSFHSGPDDRTAPNHPTRTRGASRAQKLRKASNAPPR